MFFKVLAGGPTRTYLQTIYRWTAHWLHDCKHEVADKTRNHGRTDNMQFLVWPVHRTFARQLITQQTMAVHWQPTMLKFHKESDFHLPQSQNCLLGILNKSCRLYRIVTRAPSFQIKWADGLRWRASALAHLQGALDFADKPGTSHCHSAWLSSMTVGRVPDF